MLKNVSLTGERSGASTDALFCSAHCRIFGHPDAAENAKLVASGQPNEAGDEARNGETARRGEKRTGVT